MVYLQVRFRSKLEKPFQSLNYVCKALDILNIFIFISFCNQCSCIILCQIRNIIIDNLDLQMISFTKWGKIVESSSLPECILSLEYRFISFRRSSPLQSYCPEQDNLIQKTESFSKLEISLVVYSFPIGLYIHFPIRLW